MTAEQQQRSLTDVGASADADDDDDATFGCSCRYR